MNAVTRYAMPKDDIVFLTNVRPYYNEAIDPALKDALKRTTVAEVQDEKEALSRLRQLAKDPKVFIDSYPVRWTSYKTVNIKLDLEALTFEEFKDMYDAYKHNAKGAVYLYNSLAEFTFPGMTREETSEAINEVIEASTVALTVEITL